MNAVGITGTEKETICNYCKEKSTTIIWTDRIYAIHIITFS